MYCAIIPKIHVVGVSFSSLARAHTEDIVEDVIPTQLPPAKHVIISIIVSIIVVVVSSVYTQFTT